MPGGLFNNTAISTSILILNKKKKNENILLVDTNKMFYKIRGGVAISDENIEKIIKIFHSKKELKNISKLISLEELAKNDYILTVNRYIIPEMEEEKIDLEELIKEVNTLDNEIKEVKKQIKNLIEII